MGLSRNSCQCRDDSARPWQADTIISSGMSNATMHACMAEARLWGDSNSICRFNFGNRAGACWARMWKSTSSLLSSAISLALLSSSSMMSAQRGRMPAPRSSSTTARLNWMPTGLTAERRASAWSLPPRASKIPDLSPDLSRKPVTH